MADGKHSRKEDKPVGYPIGAAGRGESRDGSAGKKGHHAEDHPRNVGRKDDKTEGQK